MTKNSSVRQEQLLKEFPPVGKYRVRLLGATEGKSPKKTLDIREYVSSESFEGFTRRGIRLNVNSEFEVELLRDVLVELLRDFGA